MATERLRWRIAACRWKKPIAASCGIAHRFMANFMANLIAEQQRCEDLNSPDGLNPWGEVSGGKDLYTAHTVWLLQSCLGGGKP